MDTPRIILVWINDTRSEWSDSIDSIRASSRSVKLVVGATRAIAGMIQDCLSEGLVVSASFSEFIAQNLPERTSWAAIITEPVEVAIDFFARSATFIKANSRVASVSFLSNGIDELRLPGRRGDSECPIDKLGAQKTTLSLQAVLKPAEAFVPFPAGPIGHVTVINVDAFQLCGGLSLDFGSTASIAITDFCLRAVQRGLTNFADTSNAIRYLSSPAQMMANRVATEPHLALLHRRHIQALDSTVESCVQPHTQIASKLATLWSRMQGLRVLIDATCLGSTEMGTQVQTLHLIRALSGNPKIEQLVVALPNGGCPPYAKMILSHPKIIQLISPDLNFLDAPQVDILHRPFQPDSPIPWVRWRSISQKIVITLQDLIAYRNPVYFPDARHWLDYRTNLRRSALQADAVVVISNDVREVVIQEDLPISADYLLVVENGTDHISESISTRTPTAMLQTQGVSQEFALVLGANYAHKNRDLAIRVWNGMRARGSKMKLILCGATVPKGSSTDDEIRYGQNNPDIVYVIDAPNEEKNWLLKHASLVLYPTSAEGFGFVPFEAAKLNTPCLHVSFGPLQELLPHNEQPKSWNVSDLVNRGMQLTQDPVARDLSIKQTLAACDIFTWQKVANQLTKAYLQTLSSPYKAAIQTLD